MDPNFAGIEIVGKVKSKGGEWREFLIISDEFKDLLRKILYEERKDMNDDTYLFSYVTDCKNRKGEIYKYDKLTNY
jgi:hypothetical protein